MVGVVGMNKIVQDKNLMAYFIFVFGLVCSFGFLALAMQTLPLGLSYAIWTGIGTVGGTVIGMLFYGESREWKRLLCIGIVLAAVMGLKLIS